LAGTVTGGNYQAAVCDVDDRTRRFLFADLSMMH